MELLQVLAGGVVGAEGGSARVLQRGTATRAVLYADFEGTSALPAADIALDEHGAAIGYVNEVVDVEAYDADSQLVRQWTEGRAAPATEVRSLSFTGADYVTGIAAAGAPTTLQAALDRLRTSFGAVDFNVLLGGVAMSLTSALARFDIAFYNVKAYPYNAVGDGVTLDHVAIQAAITAASADGGGIVFFPAGTYLIATTLTVPAGVSLMGSGAEGTIIRQNSPLHPVVTCSGSGAFPGTIEGLTLTRGVAAAAIPIVSITGGTRVTLRSCALSDSGSTRGLVYADGSANNGLLAFGCTFDIHNSTQEAIETSSSGFFAAVLCRFTNLEINLDTANIQIPVGAIVGCYFDNLAVLAGTAGNIIAGSGTVVIGCAAGTPGAVLTDASPFLSGAGFFEAANRVTTMASQRLCYFASGSTATDQASMLDSRTGRQRMVTNNTAAVTLPTQDNGVVILRKTATQAVAITLPTCPAGCELTMVVWNDHAAASGDITFAAPLPENIVGPYTVNAQCYSIFTFKSTAFNAKCKWVLVSLSSNIAE